MLFLLPHIALYMLLSGLTPRVKTVYTKKPPPLLRLSDANQDESRQGRIYFTLDVPWLYTIAHLQAPQRRFMMINAVL